nr:hypothetical protein DM860_010844 [Ipomoea batatas]
MYRDKLEEALAGASTENNKTVIIAVVNKAYVDGDKSMLDMFLDGFWVGEGTRELVKHLLIVAVDQTSYDIDVIWLRNPFPRLRDLNETLDLQISTDNFNGDDRSESNPINTGFYMVRSNNRTIALFNSCGFCQDSGDVKSVVTVHANCCRTITAKLADLMAVIHDWQRFKSFSGDANQTATFHWSPHDRCMDSWNH